MCRTISTRPSAWPWLHDKWPAIKRAAKRCKGLILFEDEASFAQWGSLSYTWSRRGHQPEVPTSGKRKGYKVFEAIEYFSGRLFYQGIEGRFTSESYQGFLQMIMAHTPEHLFLNPRWRSLSHECLDQGVFGGA